MMSPKLEIVFFLCIHLIPLINCEGFNIISHNVSESEETHSLSAIFSAIEKSNNTVTIADLIINDINKNTDSHWNCFISIIGDHAVSRIQVRIQLKIILGAQLTN